MGKGDDLWKAAKEIREKTDSSRLVIIEKKTKLGKIKMPPVSERLNAIDVNSSIREQYVKSIINKWYTNDEQVKLDDLFFDALYDPKISELVFSAALKKANKTDEILLLDKDNRYEQSDLLKMTLHEESGVHGPLIAIDSVENKLRILSAEFEFRTISYNSKGELREKISWPEYF